MLPTTFATIRITRPSPTIALVTLWRPDQRNSFNQLMTDEFEEVFQILDQDETVRAVVLTGKGDTFCAGADLNSGVLERMPGEGPKDHRDHGGRIALAIYRCRKPTVVAINGAAIGAGVTLTFPAVARIAYANAKIGMVFSQRGLIMEGASAFFLPRLIGYSNALYLSITGSILPASSPRWGTLFTELLPSPREVLPYALKIADQIATQTSLTSTYLMREMIWRSKESPEEMHLLDSELMWELYGKWDKKEGIQGFLEKRRPQFGGLEGLPSSVPWWDEIDTRTRKLKAKI